MIHKHYKQIQVILNTFQVWICLLLIKSCLLSHSFYYIFKTTYLLILEFYLKIILTQSYSIIASCSSINLDFLQSHNAHLDEIISFPLFAFVAVEFLVSVFFTLQTKIQKYNSFIIRLHGFPQVLRNEYQDFLVLI